MFLERNDELLYLHGSSTARIMATESPHYGVLILANIRFVTNIPVPLSHFRKIAVFEQDKVL